MGIGLLLEYFGELALDCLLTLHAFPFLIDDFSGRDKQGRERLGVFGVVRLDKGLARRANRFFFLLLSGCRRRQGRGKNARHDQHFPHGESLSF